MCSPEDLRVCFGEEKQIMVHLLCLKLQYYYGITITLTVPRLLGIKKNVSLFIDWCNTVMYI